jgi:TIR domain
MVAVFVSYAREDSEFAQRFCADLDRPGIEPWLDQDRLTGALGACADRRTSRYVLPLLSRHSLNPDEPGYVQTKSDIALSADKLIVPILVEAIPERLRSSPWFTRMSDYQWYYLAADYEANLQTPESVGRRP